MTETFDKLHRALSSAGPVDRHTAQAFHAAISRHADAGRITEREAITLHWCNWGNALDPFAATDPDWLTALQPDDGRRTFEEHDQRP